MTTLTFKKAAQRPILAGLVVLCCLIAASCGGDDDDNGGPVQPTPVPDIQQFSTQPSSLSPGDSALLTYKVARASTLTLNPGGINLTPVDSGQVYVKPQLATLYSLIAISSSGRDSAGVQVDILTPVIQQFLAQPADILPGDSTLLTYRVTDATTLTLNPGGANLTPIDSGQVYVKPALPTLYTLIGTSAVGTDSADLQITMNGALPIINDFVASDSLILVGDNSVLSWTLTRVDSLVLSGGPTSLTFTTVDSVILLPSVTTVYTAIAHNDIATDTASLTVSVEVPVLVDAPNGQYYKGILGSSSINPELRFWTLDAQNQLMTLPWMIFELQSGDGSLSTDSVQGGTALPTYTFDGLLSHAVLRAFVRDVDTVDVTLRASTIKPGAGTQGQFIVLNDTYATAKGFNGLPTQVDIDPSFWITYAVYEQTLGLVLGLDDIDRDEVADDNEPAFEIILTSLFTDTTLEGIGIGSPIADFRSVFGDADSVWLDPTPPAAVALRYDALGMVNFATTDADTALFEMHLFEPNPPPAPAPAAKSLASAQKRGTTRYRPVQRVGNRR